MIDSPELIRLCRECLAGADLYLLDLVLSDVLSPPARILDAGCGRGRNLAVLRHLGFDAVGLDQSLPAARSARDVVVEKHGKAQVAAGDLRALPLPDDAFDVVVANAVLHFAPSPAAYQVMLAELWRVLRPGGLFFARLAVQDGVEKELRPLREGWYGLPDGSERFLVTLSEIEAQTDAFGATRVIPLKTALVYGQRSMATWCIRKGELPIGGARVL